MIASEQSCLEGGHLTQRVQPFENLGRLRSPIHIVAQKNQHLGSRSRRLEVSENGRQKPIQKVEPSMNIADGPDQRAIGAAALGAAGGAAGYGLGHAGLGVNDALGTVVGALAGAAISTVADSYIQDTTYTLVTDIQISERFPGTVISQSEQANLQQGTSGSISQSSSDTTDAKRYRTRVVSTANQANLSWPDAEPQLVAGLTRSISGIF